MGGNCASIYRMNRDFKAIIMSHSSCCCLVVSNMETLKEINWILIDCPPFVVELCLTKYERKIKGCEMSSSEEKSGNLIPLGELPNFGSN